MFEKLITVFFSKKDKCKNDSTFSKDVRLPVQLQRAMAAEAEADREARAKIIAAEGEIKASKALREASLVMIDNPMALQVSERTVKYSKPLSISKFFYDKVSGGGI